MNVPLAILTLLINSATIFICLPFAAINGYGIYYALNLGHHVEEEMKIGFYGAQMLLACVEVIISGQIISHYWKVVRGIDRFYPFLEDPDILSDIPRSLEYSWLRYNPEINPNESEEGLENP